ncbi:Dabb family protein [Clostridiaceae bacterium HFYG-1003]|nr:Dabb family protein [Clostridiaceae bacterium HFYG-1003]
MFTHVVMMNVKDRQDIPRLAEILRSMEGRIPELRDIEVGINEVESDRNFDVILITRFDSREEMEAYQICDYHQNQVLAHIRPLLAKSAAADFTS